MSRKKLKLVGLVETRMTWLVVASPAKATK
jgi:hypothetical protein